MDATMVYSANYQMDNISEARRSKGEVVHSGHFMVSSVADDHCEHEDSDQSQELLFQNESLITTKDGYDFSKVPKETKKTYQFGPLPSNHITIDDSLSRLFRCMSLAYHGGKVVSPKWKNFKGMKLTVKDKIRLNNAIWRTWHIQYVMRRSKKNSLIQFATPLDNDYYSHSKPEAVVMEGKYWKRRIETVIAEYKKWRAFFMEKQMRLSNYPGATWDSSDNQHTSKVPEFFVDSLTDFTDTLFSSLSQQPFQFPNPKEIAMHSTNSDMIQPGLLQLQPNMDDYMDFDPLQELLSQSRKPSAPLTEHTNHRSSHNPELFQNGDLMPLVDHHAQPSSNHANKHNGMDYSRRHGLLNDSINMADPIMSAVNVDAVPFTYPTNTEQQKQPMTHMQSKPSHNMPPTLQSFIQMPQQQINPKLLENEATNIFYLSDREIRNAQIQKNIIHPAVYPQSKLGHDVTHHNVIYTRPQVSVPMKFLANSTHPQHFQGGSTGGLQLSEQTRGASSIDMKVAGFANHGAQLPNEGTNNPSTLLLQQQQQHHHHHQQQQQRGMNTNISNTTSDVLLLKQLLTNRNTAAKTSTALSKQGTRRSTGLRRNDSVGPKTATEVQFNVVPSQPQSNSHINPATRLSFPVESTSSVEKLVDESSSRFNSTPQPWLSPPNMNNEASSCNFAFHGEEMELDTSPSHLPSQEAETHQQERNQRSESCSTEQKRRLNIKLGFSRLQKLLPGVSIQPNVKISKATLMSKAAQHIKLLQAERIKMNEEIQALKQDLDKLRHSINNCQQQLPATGAPIPRPRIEEGKNQFHCWVWQRTRQDWKFHIFGIVIHPWFDSYQRMVSVTNSQDLCRTLFEWMEQKCSLRVLRPGVVQSLQVLCTTTPILTDASLLQQHIEEEAARKENNESINFR